METAIFPLLALMLFSVVSRKTSPTTSFPSSVTSLNATGTTLGSLSEQVARSHILSFNNFFTFSFIMIFAPFLLPAFFHLLWLHYIRATHDKKYISKFNSRYYFS